MNNLMEAIAFTLCASFALFVCWALQTLCALRNASAAQAVAEAARIIQDLESRISALEAQEPKP